MRPEELHYSKEHEWVRIEGEGATIGITDFAAGELGDIVLVELPEVGSIVEAGDPMGTIETVKSVEELYAPISGTVTEINDGLEDNPELVNEEPFGDGWMIRLEGVSTEDAELMTASAYGDMVGE
jgi:glycine cleavage system H protein